MKRAATIVLALALTLIAIEPAHGAQRSAPAAAETATSTRSSRALGHEAYEIWKGIDDEAISRDGRWVSYRLTLQEGDPELVVRSVADGREYRVPRGDGAVFTAATTHLVALIRPPRADVRQAKLDDKKPDEHPKSHLVIVDLATGEQTVIERVKSFRVPEDAGEWVAYLQEEELPAGGVEGEDDAHAEEEPSPEPGEERVASDDAEKEEKREPKKDGTALVRRDLASGNQARYESVIEYAAAADGTLLAYLTSTSDDSADGAFRIWVGETRSADSPTLLDGAGRYSDLAVSDTGGSVAFLSDRDSYEDDQPEAVLYYAAPDAAAVAVARQGSAGLDDGWWVSAEATPYFSRTGGRLYFGAAPRPAPETDDEPMLEEEKVKVDIWNWKDPLLQPMQLLQAEDEHKRTYLAVAHLDADAGATLVQLAHSELRSVEIPDEGNGDYAYGASGLPYRQEISWDFPRFADHVLVDVVTGERSMIAERHQGPFEVSPDGGWAVWWDNEALAWQGREMARDSSGSWSEASNLTAVIRHAVHNEDHDWPYRPFPYGLAGWLSVPDELRGDGAPVDVLVYDRFDIWAVDPAGSRTPRQVTSGFGRQEQVRLRYVRLDPDAEYIEDATLLLSGLHEGNKDAGFWRVAPFGPEPPAAVIREPKRFGRPIKAEGADVLLYTREDVGEFPDLWVNGLDFSDAQRISDANPQQSEYNWATAELTTWRSLDGEPLQGLVHKPADFDPDKKYPMLVYFYERNANNLHQHHAPTPHRSIIRPTFYASRGYVVFTPDITYAVGYPGESALKDVISGVLHMIDQGYVDVANIGVQGHSWGGYQIAYLVTKTDIFKAAAGGAPVSNMVSAYGGIRWGSGMSRMFQYERTQSRLGGSLWEAPMRYIENSPIFWADKVNTPLLMLHNDEDGAVPWYQGIEMFVALRRLGRPAWLVNYNGEPHWPTTYANKRDWNIRMQQFFDHYLMGEPAPRWLDEGIPAIEKGKTLGLELLDDDRQAGAASRQR